MSTYTTTELKQMLDAFWFENTGRSINGTDPNVWLKKLIDSVYGTHKVVSNVKAVATIDIDLSAICAGETIDEITLATGDLILAINKDDAAENGFYIIGENAGETERHLDFSDPASCNGYFVVMQSPQIAVGKYFLITVDVSDVITIYKNTDGYDERWKQLIPGIDFTTTATTTSTAEMLKDLSAIIRPGMAVKHKRGGAYYYGIVDEIATDLLTIAGAAFTTSAAAIQELYYSPLPQMTDVVNIVFAGKFAETGTDSMVNDLIGAKIMWQKNDAFIVKISGIAKTDDSGASQAHYNVLRDDDPVCTSNTNAGISVSETWTETAVDIDTNTYNVRYGNIIELSTDAAGTNGDAEDLTVQILIVFE